MIQFQNERTDLVLRGGNFYFTCFGIDKMWLPRLEITPLERRKKLAVVDKFF